MPFNISDNVSTWFYSCLEEEYDALEPAIRDEWMEQHTGGLSRQYLTNAISDATGISIDVLDSDDMPLALQLMVDSISHSINYDWVEEQLRAYHKEHCVHIIITRTPEGFAATYLGSTADMIIVEGQDVREYCVGFPVPNTQDSRISVHYYPDAEYDERDAIDSRGVLMNAQGDGPYKSGPSVYFTVA